MPLLPTDSSSPSTFAVPALDAQELVKTYRRGRRGPGIPVLRRVSLSIAQGEFVAIVGPSGSGKSTLLFCLSSLERPTSGSMRIDGEDPQRMSRSRLARFRRERIGFVFQQFALIPSLSARENTALPLRLAGREDAPARADAALAEVGLSHRAGYGPRLLSGGEQQRVAIARVLAAEPAVVFADEPTGALDAVAGDTVLRLLRSVADEGRSVVMVTHDLEAAARADRVLVLRDGVLRADLTAPSTAQIWTAMTSAAPSAQEVRS
ncbi:MULTISPECIES: ABC transporter ATP-binding protein [unclassified Rathayibacter]|uniref:ABC transporter ATP-binding protein n=1 Tax=unclassified Rathayibacter TaxID=2609250 RepID=UPI00188D5FD7|nr:MULTISPECIES: ABC transporter ATP-binding protein [unclassified Rathayibacter]MBF4463285.1 ABC transporter ATP-binding protein [Rathayibacter sp. VKM Ac-2879]MBF4504478.1 ABC transporter ATP-binding protein [Rathayibacter sp. VKM Ac-2878]